MDLTSLNKDRKRKKTTADMSAMVWGKVPPQAKELEEAVLGALLLEKSAYEKIEDIATADMFYVEANKLIFRCIEHIYRKNETPDILTVVEELKFREQLDAVGGPYYVTKLTNDVVSSANIERHAKIVYQKFIQRELIRVSGEIIGEAYEDSTDVFDCRDRAEAMISAIGSEVKKIETPEQHAMRFISDLDERIHAKKHGSILNIPSGYPNIDALTNGWKPKWLITLAAMPSVGKSSLALNFARNAAMAPNPEPVLYLTREMGCDELYENLVSMESQVALDNLMTGDISEDMRQKKIAQAVDKIMQAPIYFEDVVGMTWRQVRALIRRYQKIVIQRQKDAGIKNPRPLRFVIEDYVQLSEDEDIKGKNREQQVATISKENKKTAKMLNVAYMQLSQLVGKQIANRKNMEPLVTDVRESSAIEQDSDILMLIYRPEYHEQYVDENGKSTKGKTIIKFGKFRKGKRNARVELTAHLSIQKFISTDDPEPIIHRNTEAEKIFNPEKKNEEFDEGFNEAENLRFK